MAWLALAEVLLLAGTVLLVGIGNGWPSRVRAAGSSGARRAAPVPLAVQHRAQAQQLQKQPVSASDEPARAPGAADRQADGAAHSLEATDGRPRQAAAVEPAPDPEPASQQPQQRSIREVLEEASRVLAAAELAQQQHAAPEALAAQEERPLGAAAAPACEESLARPSGLLMPSVGDPPMFVGVSVSEGSTSNTSLQSSLPRRHQDTESLASTSLAGTSMPDTVSARWDALLQPALRAHQAWLHHCGSKGRLLLCTPCTRHCALPAAREGCRAAGHVTGGGLQASTIGLLGAGPEPGLDPEPQDLPHARAVREPVGARPRHGPAGCSCARCRLWHGCAEASHWLQQPPGVAGPAALHARERQCIGPVCRCAPQSSPALCCLDGRTPDLDCRICCHPGSAEATGA